MCLGDKGPKQGDFEISELFVHFLIFDEISFISGGLIIFPLGGFSDFSMCLT